MRTEDGRKRLRAHWPPRRANIVTLTIDRQLYEKLWLAADAAEHSLQDEIRHRLARSFLPMR